MLVLDLHKTMSAFGLKSHVLPVHFESERTGEERGPLRPFSGEMDEKGMSKGEREGRWLVAGGWVTQGGFVRAAVVIGAPVVW